MKILTLYMLTCRETGKSYIGITSNSVSRRWHSHVTSARLGRKTALCYAIMKYGPKSFDRTEVASALSWEDASFLECQIISDRNTLSPNGYNIAEGGQGKTGPLSEEEREKRRHRVRAITFAGTKHSPETKKLMSENAKRRGCSHLHTPEVIAKRAETQKGRKGKPHSKESRLKMSLNNGSLKKWVNNGTTHRRIPMDSQITDGWVYGRLFAHRKRRNQ